VADNNNLELVVAVHANKPNPTFALQSHLAGSVGLKPSVCDPKI
jgi:hypothetical protein